MGYNTAILILNDQLSDIEKSPDHFVKGLSSSIHRVASPRTEEERAHGVDFSPGPATAVSCAHANNTQLIAFGGNCATKLGIFGGYDHHTPEGQEQLLRAWADQMGFRLVRKAKA